MKIINMLLFGLLAAATPALIAAPTAEPTAASLAFTSQDPVVLQARDLMAAGKFKEAEALLTEKSSTGSSEAKRAREEALEIIRRTRYEYSLSTEELLEKLKKTIPDVTAADVERWTKETKVRYRMIDGQKLYFRREPQNIFLFSKEAKKRRAKSGNEPAKGDWKLTDHLQTIVDEAESTGKTELQPIRHKFTHTVIINSNAPGLKAGSVVRAWLPYPQEYRQQREVKLISATPEPKVIAPSAIEGNPVGGAPQRTIYFEQTVVDPTKPIQFTINFEYVSYAYYPKLEEKAVQPLPANWDGADLGERAPHIVFTPEMREVVAKVVGKETNSLVKARKIFHWVSKNIPWNAEDEYCIIPSFALKAFNARRGDCGLQNSVYVTLCRIAGIPARWQSGYETKPGTSWGMHDWAEIYIAPWGWLPADASYGVKESKDPRVADFYCGHQDSYRMIVNLDWGRELVPPKKSIRSEPADFQRGEVEVDGKNLYYDQWTSNTTLERDPGPNNDVLKN